jgi:hypothetical protein
MDEMTSNPVRVLPDPAICRVRSIGSIAGFAHCLVRRPAECPHVLYFGEGNICRHPDWKQFLESGAKKEA